MLNDSKYLSYLLTKKLYVLQNTGVIEIRWFTHMVRIILHVDWCYNSSFHRADRKQPVPNFMLINTISGITTWFEHYLTNHIDFPLTSHNVFKFILRATYATSSTSTAIIFIKDIQLIPGLLLLLLA